MKRTWVGGLMVLGAAALWGTLGIFAKLLYRAGFTPLELASARALIAFLGLALWMAPRPARLKIAVRDVPFFLLYGVVCVAIFEYVYFATLERTTVSIAVALLYTAPAFVVLLGRAAGGKAPGKLEVAALLLVLTGVFLVTGALRALVTGGAAVTTAALALGLGSGLTYALYTLLGKRAIDRYGPLRTILYAFGFGALALVLVAPPWRPVLERPGSLPLVLMLGLLPTLLAYLLYLGGLRYLPASTASMLASIEPVVAALLGVLLLREPIGGDQAAGIALVVGAALLLARSVATTPELETPPPEGRP